MCRFDDGLLEVFGVYSSLHIARLNVSLAEPIRLGRAKRIKVSRMNFLLWIAIFCRVLKIALKSGQVPVHVDGEPWEQSPSVITIAHHNQLAVMQKRTEK